MKLYILTAYWAEEVVPIGTGDFGTIHVRSPDGTERWIQPDEMYELAGEINGYNVFRQVAIRSAENPYEDQQRRINEGTD